MATVVNIFTKHIGLCSSLLSRSVSHMQKSKFYNFSHTNKLVKHNFEHIKKRNFVTDYALCGSAARAETTSTTQGLSKLQAQELVLRLNGEERSILISALQEYQSKLVKDEYEGKFAVLFIHVLPLLSYNVHRCFYFVVCTFTWQNPRVYLVFFTLLSVS